MPVGWRSIKLLSELISNCLNLLLIEHLNKSTSLNDGSLGSLNDEERSEMRYVMWIAGFSESSSFWTQMAPGRFQRWGKPGSDSLKHTTSYLWSFGSAGGCKLGRSLGCGSKKLVWWGFSCGTRHPGWSNTLSWWRSQVARYRNPLTTRFAKSWAQVRGPAEFKHITRRRKRK